MIKFHIDKEHGMVIASYPNGKKDFRSSLVDMAYALVDKNDIRIGFYDLVDKTMDEVVVYVGRSKLHEGDTWDEEKGKELALVDLHNRFNKAKIRLLERMKKRMMANYSHFMDSLNHKIEK